MGALVAAFHSVLAFHAVALLTIQAKYSRQVWSLDNVTKLHKASCSIIDEINLFC